SGALRQQFANAIGYGFAVSIILSSPMYIHSLAESMKHAFADRSRWLGDPAFVDVPVARLMDPEYQKDRAATFRPDRTLPPGEYGTDEIGSESRAAQDHGTSHFCVIDQWGSAVSSTETINLGFGSCL